MMAAARRRRGWLQNNTVRADGTLPVSLA